MTYTKHIFKTTCLPEITLQQSISKDTDDLRYTADYMFSEQVEDNNETNTDLNRPMEPLQIIDTVDSQQMLSKTPTDGAQVMTGFRFSYVPNKKGDSENALSQKAENPNIEFDQFSG